MIYQCYRCLWTNNIKTKMKDHLSRLRPCKMVNNEINLDDCKEYILSGMSYNEYCEKIMVNKKSIKSHENSIKSHEKVNKKSIKGQFICKYCDKILSYKQSLHTHLKICEEKKKDDTVRESMEELVKLLNKKDVEHKKELDKRDKQIEELIKKAGISTNNSNNNSNNITNIQNNFKLLNYKETDTSHLTENDYVRCLEHYNFCVPHLIRKLHFNPKKPENHNIYISNLKNNYVMIYINNKWKVKNRDETISRMIDDKQVILEKKIQEWVESGIQYPKVMAKFSRYIEKREDNDVINAIKEDIKLMLYNNRNMVIESKKLLK